MAVNSQEPSHLASHVADLEQLVTTNPKVLLVLYLLVRTKDSAVGREL